MFTLSNIILLLTKLGVVLAAFCAPFLYLIHSIIFLVFVDLITAIMRDMKIKNAKGVFGKAKVIKSHKLRKSGIKLFLYILFILSTYVLMIAGFGSTYFIMEFVFLSFSLVELTSIGANISIVTGKSVFTETTKKIVTWITKKISIMFE